MVTNPAASIAIVAAVAFSSITFARLTALLNIFGVSSPLPLSFCKVSSLILVPM
jgi:hypothetical protein